ncbi:MAG: sialate O-acetylesterase [Planctomycetota bacterium]|jgi:hypothetical protein
MKQLGLCFFALVASCGSGGSDPSPTTLSVLAISAPISAEGGTPFSITGVGFPGTPGDIVTVRFVAEADRPFDGCRSDTLEQTATLRSDSRIDAVSISDVLVGDVDCYVTLVFKGGQKTSSAQPIAVLRGVSDPAFDHDLNGVADRCDPNTYDFQGDAIGSRPGDTARVDGADDGFVIADAAGDRAAHYPNAENARTSDAFTRLRADYARQDLTAYIDFEDKAAAAHIEIWSDGSHIGRAGAGLLLKVDAAGALSLLLREWRDTSELPGTALPASRRIRVRVRKQAGTATHVHIDAWESGAWTLDTKVFVVADDTPFVGRDVAMAEHGDSTRGITRVTVVYEMPPGNLTLARDPNTSEDWKVFQRDADDEATVPLRVRYRLSAPGRLQARVVEAGTDTVLPGHAWTDHETLLTPASGARADLAVAGIPTGGNYDVQVRLIDAATSALLGEELLREIAVGDVYLCVGQSNMAGFSGTLAGATDPIPEVHLLHNSDRWMQATEPADDSANQRDSRPYDRPKHSPMLPFGKSLYEATGVPVGLIPGPLSGSNLYSQWQRLAADPDHRDTLYGSALRRASLYGPNHGGLPPRGIVWFQGESDALAQRTTAQYRTDLERMIAQFRSDLDDDAIVFLCVQIGTSSGGNFPAWTDIQEAQRQVCRADPLAALMTSMDQPRTDGFHYTVPGYQEIGKRIAEQARVLVFGDALDPLTELVDVVAVSGGNGVELRYDATVSGGEASLYEVTDAAGEVAVTGVSASGSTVTLQLGRALGADARVRYGTSTNANASWVTDAAGRAVPAFADESVAP